jgi:hypothetical protein
MTARSIRLGAAISAALAFEPALPPLARKRGQRSRFGLQAFCKHWASAAM